MTLPVDGYQLKGISPRAFEHPADRAATAALASIPGLYQVVRKLIELGYERALRAAYLGAAVRLGPAQPTRPRTCSPTTSSTSPPCRSCCGWARACGCRSSRACR